MQKWMPYIIITIGGIIAVTLFELIPIYIQQVRTSIPLSPLLVDEIESSRCGAYDICNRDCVVQAAPTIGLPPGISMPPGGSPPPAMEIVTYQPRTTGSCPSPSLSCNLVRKQSRVQATGGPNDQRSICECIEDTCADLRGPNFQCVDNTCIEDAYCCGVTAPIGGASTLPHNPCVRTTQSYTYQTGTGGTFGPPVTKRGHQICATSTVGGGGLNYSLSNLAQCNIDCEATVRLYTCPNWPGYTLPAPPAGLTPPEPGPTVDCDDIDALSTSYEAACNAACAPDTCVMMRTGHSWDCRTNPPDNTTWEGREEGAWLCTHYACLNPPRSPCQRDATHCDGRWSAINRIVLSSPVPSPTGILIASAAPLLPSTSPVAAFVAPPASTPVAAVIAPPKTLASIPPIAALPSSAASLSGSGSAPGFGASSSASSGSGSAPAMNTPSSPFASAVIALLFGSQHSATIPIGSNNSLASDQSSEAGSFSQPSFLAGPLASLFAPTESNSASSSRTVQSIGSSAQQTTQGSFQVPTQEASASPNLFIILLSNLFAPTQIPIIPLAAIPQPAWSCTSCASCGSGLYNICSPSECSSLGPCIYSGFSASPCESDPLFCQN